jgi:hypothetical protein
MFTGRAAVLELLCLFLITTDGGGTVQKPSNAV